MSASHASWPQQGHQPLLKKTAGAAITTRGRSMDLSPSRSSPRRTAVCRSPPPAIANNARTKPIRRGISDGVILLMDHEETRNSRTHWRVVRRHQPDQYGGAPAVRSDSDRGRGPVDWRRHVFRRGACRHRHHPAQTPVGKPYASDPSFGSERYAPGILRCLGSVVENGGLAKRMNDPHPVSRPSFATSGASMTCTKSQISSAVLR